MTRKEYSVIVLVLGALCTVSPFSIDMYLPGFPAIAKDLNTSVANVQLSITAYLIGISVGQLIYGPLLDKYGRKSPLYAGMIIYFIASLLCARTNSVEQLIAMRFFQAVGGCAGLVSAQALVRDIFPLNKTAQAFSLLTLVVAVSPMVAPTVGGYVTSSSFGWHGVFIILAIISAIIISGIFFLLPDGKKPDSSISLRPKAVAHNFLIVMKQPQFFTYTLMGGVAGAASFAYIAGSADVFITIYKVSEQQYGWIFALLASAMIGSTQLNHILLKTVKSEKIIKIALYYQIATGLVMVLGTWLQLFNALGLVIAMFVFLCGHGLIGPNASALSLAPFIKHAGSAAALMGSLRMAIGGMVSALVSLAHNDTPLPMIAGMFLCTASALFILLLRKISKFYRARKNKGKEATITWDL
jgi:DHA1 family bicyclomycin/chloramphenicol resistance-like MFS transporter